MLGAYEKLRNMKAFVIYKEGDELSTELAEECIASASKFNITVSKFPGVYENIEDLIKTEGLFLNKTAEDRVTKKGVLGCFLSHLFLWKKCILENVPFLIFEYDAILINPLPDLSLFEDFLHLDYNRHLNLKNLDVYESNIVNSDNPTIEKFVGGTANVDTFKFLNRNHIRGSFAYILKPSGAKKLVESLRLEGILPSDIALNQKYIQVNYTIPSIARLSPNALSVGLVKLSHTKNS